MIRALEEFVEETKARFGMCREWKRELGLEYTDKDWLDSAVLGGVSIRDFVHDIQAGKIDINDIDPDIIKALHLQYPHVGNFIEFVKSHPSDAELRGIASGLRGKLLEIKHLEMIQKSLEHGYTAHLAESPNQAGWDIVINDPRGYVVQLIQDKVNPTMALVRRFVENNPHIDIATTHEALQHLNDAGLHEHLLDTGVSMNDIDVVNDTVQHVSHAEIIAYKIPYLSLLAIAATEGRAASKGKSAIRDLVPRLWFRSKRALAANAAAQALYWITGEPMLMLTASLFRITITRWDVANGLVRSTEARRKRIQQIAALLRYGTPDAERRARVLALLSLAQTA
jgi:hypothetical protein